MLAMTRAVQSLTVVSAKLLANPRIGEKLGALAPSLGSLAKLLG